ncbi:MAG: HAD-IIIC family phosphatase [Paenibacillaceae bacterium]
MSDVLTYLSTADTLLSSLPTREQMTRSPIHSVIRTHKVRVDRTMPFELIGNLLPPFCGLWEAGVQFDYSDYDATLSQLGGDYQADVYIIWLDWRIYHQSMAMDEAVHWLMGRIRQLRDVTAATIWVNNWPESLDLGDTLFGLRVGERGRIRRFNECLSEYIEPMTGCEMLDLAGIAYEATGIVYDRRNDEISSYPFSDSMTIRIAQHLGAQLLPATFLPRLKAIALDLDDTLYSGVLGEDGWDRVNLTEGHYELQKLLLKLKHSGMILTICSRNEEQDVKSLFEGREDFPLQWTDFAVICANWQSKADNLQQLTQQLNIDPAAFLFIDDNPVELLKMAEVMSSVKLLRADHDGMGTMNKLCHYPGLYQIRPDHEAALRTADIQANQIRKSLKEKASVSSTYMESLRMAVTIHVNEPSHAGRLFDMSRKTNQFNLALRRMTEIEAQAVMNKEQYVTLTVRLSDIVSDSGIIGALVCSLEGRKARLIETIFSCRALGRDIESVSFACLLERLSLRGIELLDIDVKDGPRNAPAIEWLKRFVQDIRVNIPLEGLSNDVRIACMQHPSKVEVIA